MDTEIGFESPAAFRAFTEELAASVTRIAAKYDSSGSKSRRFRVVLGSHPAVTKSEADAAAETAAHRRARRPHRRRNTARRIVMPRKQDARNRHRRADRSGLESDLRGRRADALVRRGSRPSSPGRRHDRHLVGRRREERRARSTRGSRTRSCARSWRRSRWARRSPTARRRWSTSTRSSAATARRCCGWCSSGIPDGKEWDGFYNGTNTGWASFFRTLKHYLEHHRGQPRTTIKIIGQANGIARGCLDAPDARRSSRAAASSSNRRRRRSRR